jgi:hypothetical protein
MPPASDAFAAIVITPLTLAPSGGDVIATLGGALSGLISVTTTVFVVEFPAKSSACNFKV